MKHDLLIYILKLEDLPFIKLGKSENLRIRIKQIVKEYECLIDYNESYVIKASTTYIKHQERQLLNDIPFDLTDEEYEPFENSTGSTELRKESNLEKIIEYFNLKKSLFKLDIDIIKGINFSGFYSPRIPERFYPIEKKATPLLKELGEQVQKIAQERGVDDFTAFNEILYEYFLMKKIIRSEEISNIRMNYFHLPRE